MRSDRWRLVVVAGMADTTRQNATEKQLSSRQRDAAVLLAEDNLTDADIADLAGVHRATLDRWKDLPLFRQAVADHTAELERRMLRLAIARKRERVKILDTVQAKILQVIDARSTQYPDVPGADSGLLVGQLKQVKHITTNADDGPQTWTEETWEYAFDAAIVRELRGTQEQAAKEVGQWSDNVTFGGTTTIQLVNVTPGDV